MGHRPYFLISKWFRVLHWFLLMYGIHTLVIGIVGWIVSIIE